MKARLRRLGRVPKIIKLRPPRDQGTKIWLAGRASNCAIYTKSFCASRQHFLITYREDNFFISDLQSANGTFLNDEKLMSEKLLSPGSTISIGVPSELQDLPDCIVYVFELYSDESEDEQESAGESDTESVFDDESDSEAPELENGNMDKNPRQGPKDKPSDEPNVDDAEITVVSATTSSDVVLVEASGEPKPAKRRRLGESSIGVAVKQEQEDVIPIEVKDENDTKPIKIEEDVSAYEASTQEIKTEPGLLNYSQTEELIELSDSEEDFVSAIKQEESKSPEQGDEDDDIVILKTIIRSPCNVRALPSPCCLPKTDKKCTGGLLKIKEETDSAMGNDDSTQGELWSEIVVEEVKIEMTDEVNESSVDPGNPGDPGNPAGEPQRLSVQEDVAEPEAPPRAEAPKRRAGPKKSVTFDMVPQVRYFEVAYRPRWAASEAGRSRFNKLVFNICSWNAFWLEECKTVSSDKYPPNICEEEHRKITKRFPSHANYMSTYVPAMLLHLWYKVRDKWITSRDSLFRQTVSFDYCEDYEAENLSVFNCSGLVRSVDGHKQLFRDGHLVVLRVHRFLPPAFVACPWDENLRRPCYLIFGFVESRSYEPYRDQALHLTLAKKGAMIPGELYVVRMKILVKMRPDFQVDYQKLVQLTVVHQMSQELGLFRGICFLPDSPLCPVILKPSKIRPPTRRLPRCDLVFRGLLDAVQSDIVKKLSHTCSSTDSVVRCVTGAAGTGKGQVIVALVLQLLFGREWRRRRPKIIYCTQWGIPLDEMTLRLKECSRTADEPFSLVRVGALKEMKADVRDLCVSSLAKRRQSSSKRAPGGREVEPEVEVIRDADVICTTCSSAAISEMCSAFEKVLPEEVILTVPDN